MPILVKDFQFSETEDEASICVPLKGVAPSKVDIYSDDSYIKINFPPYFFELDLFDRIDDVASKATIGGGVVTFQVVKAQTGVWNSPRCELAVEERKERRQAAQARLRDRHETEAKEREMRKHQERRDMVDKQLKVEQKQRAEVERAKDIERDEAANDLKGWLETSNDTQKAPDVVHEELSEHELAAIRSRVRKQLERTYPERKLPPPPRKQGEITITFTPREQRSAARESEDVKWQHYVKRRDNVHKKDTSEDLQNETPALLAARAEKFVSASDFRSALAALTAAIALAPHDPTLLANRAAVYLRMRNHNGCAVDCEAALGALDEAVSRAAEGEGVAQETAEEGAKKLRSKLWARWGAAEIGRGRRNQGVELLKKALRFNPGADDLRRDVEALSESGGTKEDKIEPGDVRKDVLSEIVPPI
ncbi:hypothetical protein M427DRAFT_137151 [Gonapodya prolifera JEL478]|uniref:Dynein axonemal assembly factor 4 n=1 Tax=Gonapodya prolifera (strain JEL478) TaxID=1344416 RepID=A0A139A755_GONPJ|nr:hypothetical protein M427DRAFT_137151 [Gonapodya prolifera JEL478]|eukprot:KXS12630.1 hypothetical protein M427DRAFT_137151 [Gonapodya prolifera JEL478]